MAFFIMEYRKKGYALSDAFRLDPKWGKRTFTVSSHDLGTDDIEAVRKMAASREATPEGYELFSVVDRDAPISTSQLDS
jgi:hypothetical protein